MGTGIDRYTKEEFEAALSHRGKNWEHLGLIDGEHVYAIPFSRPDKERFRIVIRSTVRADGVAADTGLDSIRCWLEAADVLDTDGNLEWVSIGKDDVRWTTRVPGWARRLTGRNADGELVEDENTILRRLWRLAHRTVVRCPKCGHWRSIATAKTEKNKGRRFTSCPKPKYGGCGKFGEWLSAKTENGK